MYIILFLKSDMFLVRIKTMVYHMKRKTTQDAHFQMDSMLAMKMQLSMRKRNFAIMSSVENNNFGLVHSFRARYLLYRGHVIKYGDVRDHKVIKLACLVVS